MNVIQISTSVEHLLEVDGLQYVRTTRIIENKMSIIWKRNFDFNDKISIRIKSYSDLEVLFQNKILYDNELE